MATVLAVLLAAGAGRRFVTADGQHKLLAPLEGEPLCAHAVRHALESGLEVIVVTGAEPAVADIARGVARHLGADADRRLHVVTNPDWQRGQATSLQIGLSAAADRGAHAVVVGLADQPRVTPAAWKALAAFAAPLAVATYDGARGNPVRLDADIWHLLPTEGDSGARELMRLRPELVQEVPCQGSATDIDTAEDLRRWN